MDTVLRIGTGIIRQELKDEAFWKNHIGGVTCGRVMELVGQLSLS
jgi:hypothetical protein